MFDNLGKEQRRFRFPVVLHPESGSGRINAPHGGRNLYRELKA